MSYFNHPIKVAVFTAAIFGLVERLIRMAGMTETVQIQVVFTGDSACAVWSNVQGRIRGTIKLPELKKGSVIDREKANRWVAYVIHEVWHVVFTAPDVWQQFAASSPKLMVGIGNAVEDARIERSGLELGYAEGFRIVGKDLLQHLLMAGGMDVNPNSPAQLPWVFAVGCRAYGIKGERRLLSALDPRIMVLVREAKRRVDAIPATASPSLGTHDSIAIAQWVYAELQKLSTAQPEPPDVPVNPEPPEDEQGEDGDEDGPVGPSKRKPPERKPRDDEEESDDDSEREAGEADDDYGDADDGDDDGETGDVEGDGEGGDGPGGEGDEPPLRVGDKVICPDGTKGTITQIVNDDATVNPAVWEPQSRAS